MNRPKLISISILRRPTDPAGPIDLTIKVPADAHIEIVTGKNAATLRGVPSSASIRSIAGEVKVEFEGAANAEINARSITGFVKSDLPQLKTENGHVLQARVGNGGPTLKVNTQSGPIVLSMKENIETARVARRFDDPLGPETPIKAAGTPAPLLDAQEISEGDVVRVDSQLVALNMSVIDRTTNRGLIGLTKSDFRLFENGSPQEILQFDSSAAPFDLLLLIDVSGSTRNVMELIRGAALRFVNAARPVRSHWSH